MKTCRGCGKSHLPPMRSPWDIAMLAVVVTVQAYAARHIEVAQKAGRVGDFRTVTTVSRHLGQSMARAPRGLARLLWGDPL